MKDRLAVDKFARRIHSLCPRPPGYTTFFCFVGAAVELHPPIVALGVFFFEIGSRFLFFFWVLAEFFFSWVFFWRRTRLSFLAIILLCFFFANNLSRCASCPDQPPNTFFRNQTTLFASRLLCVMLASRPDSRLFCMKANYLSAHRLFLCECQAPLRLALVVCGGRLSLVL